MTAFDYIVAGGGTGSFCAARSPRRSTRLGSAVPLALGRVPVDPARSRDANEIVRARPAPADKGRDDV
jgi:hypothetical protein